MILAALTTLLLSIFSGPFFIRKLCEWKIGQKIRKEECPPLAELHGKKENTPTMGGGLILTTLLLSLFLWMDLTHSFTLILLLTTLILGVLGARDDWLKLKKGNAKGLRPRKKLLVQFLVGLGVAVYLLVPGVSSSIEIGGWFASPTSRLESQGEQVVSEKYTTQEYASQVFIPFLKRPLFSWKGVLGRLVGGAFIIFVIVGCSNAVNLTDGLDGLAAGCLLLVSGTLGIVAFLSNHLEISRYLQVLYIEGSGEVAVYLFALTGACLGFLWYNGYPAQVFMGDTGSLALGGILGVSAVLLRREFLLALVGGIFLIEALSVVIQVLSYRLRNKKRVFLCAPLHHHYEYKGWPETKVVLRFWIVGLLLSLVGLASLKLQ